jgi:hypothetical protein
MGKPKHISCGLLVSFSAVNEQWFLTPDWLHASELPGFLFKIKISQPHFRPLK